jgi:hypothetical protein
MRARKLNKAIAYTFGYFWKPCPICSQFFGGHEWKTEHPNSSIYTSKTGGSGICPDCTKSGKAINLNKQFWNSIKEGKK